MSDPTYSAFSVFAFLGFVVALIPLPWHLQAWNAGTCIYMMWTSLASLVEFVDSIVWHGSAQNVAPVWCDITTKFLIGAGVGIPASSLCINRRLYKITSVQSASNSRIEKRRAVYEDIGIAIGFPLLIMALHYIVQGHRFNILEDVGCIPDTYNTPAAYPLVFIWPVLLGCISFIYAGLTLRAFLQRRAQFRQVLSTNIAMTISRYFRLILLCCVDMACTIPLTAFSIYINNNGIEMAPYISWANVHYNFSFVDEIPAVLWMSNYHFYIATQMGRWIYPGSAFLFFILFGFAEEATKNYKMAYWAVVGVSGFKHREPSLKSDVWPHSFKSAYKITSSDSLPSYSPPKSAFRAQHPSLSSSLTKPDLDFDVEKALPQTPLSLDIACEKTFPSDVEASPAATLHSDLSPRVLLEESPFSFYNKYAVPTRVPVDVDASEALNHPGHKPYPSQHRFSATIYTGQPQNASGLGGIQVLVQTESTESL